MNSESAPVLIPQGYRFGAVACGVKQSGKLDLSVLVADQPCTTFGAFTQNRVRASSVDWNQSRIGQGQAIVINSGNANACTGEQGIDDTKTMAVELARHSGCDVDDAYVMSTGIIGEHLPIDLIRNGIQEAFVTAGNDQAKFDEFADGILTTDKYRKQVSVEFETDSGNYKILGVAKGAGMIGPKMATLLCVLMTDFPLSDSGKSRKKFKAIIDRSFNSISVDGHTSTSDQVVLFAAHSRESSSAEDLFFAELEKACVDLAKMIPSDGEGATHLIEVKVQGKQTEHELRVVGKTVSDSLLVKTAIFGADPNWGRIVSAAGYSGIEFDPMETSLWVNGFLLYQNGTPAKFDATEVSQSIRSNFATSIVLELSSQNTGPQNHARCWTSDLTYEYVKINAEYHT